MCDLAIKLSSPVRFWTCSGALLGMRGRGGSRGCVSVGDASRAERTNIAARRIMLCALIQTRAPISP